MTPASRRTTAFGAAVVALGLAGSLALGGSSASADKKDPTLLGGLLTPVTQTVTGVTGSLLGSPQTTTTTTTKQTTTTKKTSATKKTTRVKAASTTKKTQPATSNKNGTGLVPGLVGTVTGTVDQVVNTTVPAVGDTVDNVVKTVPKVVHSVTNTVQTVTTETVPAVVDSTVRTVRALLGTGVSSSPPPTSGSGGGGTGQPGAPTAPGQGSTPGPIDGGLIPTLPIGGNGGAPVAFGPNQPVALIAVAPPDANQRPDAASRNGGSGSNDGDRSSSFPAGLSALPAATTILVATMLAFMIGVIGVVMTAGYRGRRTA